MKRFLLTVGLITLVCCAAWAYQAWSSYYTIYRLSSHVQKLNEDEDNLFYALQQYHERMGSYPAGDNLDIAKALSGNNSRSLIIVVGHHQSVNDKGEFIDPWGTPLRIYFSGNNVLIRSAGPNKRFDDTAVLNSDDIYRSN
jgi:hypothetical protein